MKIRRLILKNILSYKERTEFVFNDRINILIGPNGGGKSNLQKILAFVLSKYFMPHYQFTRSDQEARIEVHEPYTRRQLERVLERYFDDPTDQEIHIELIPERADVENIKAIGKNLERLNEHLAYWERKLDSYQPLDFVEEIAKAPSFSYVIRNLDFQEPQKGTPSWAFRQYLMTFFMFMRVANEIDDINLSSPVFFFFSERSFGKTIDVQQSHLAQQQYFDGYRNAQRAAFGENTNLLQWGAQHFMRLNWKAITLAAEDMGATTKDYIEREMDVQLLNRYMRQLGYEWGFATDREKLTYVFTLIKDDVRLTANRFSSGEKEIVHFLLALFALNAKDGIVLVDEPELHLHPRWQRIFLGLFRELAPERNDQFLISTHSPIFVTPDTINNITRIYKTPGHGSTKVALSEIELPDKKNLVRMINSQNNERIFFADKVVLVEGISDRLVISSLLEASCARFANNEAIEIVEAGGKNNFSDYLALLAALKTPSFVVADQDHLSIVGRDEIRALFMADAQKQWEAIAKDKKSGDAKTMVGLLRQAVEDQEIEPLKAFLNYLNGRHKRLKPNLGVSEQATVNAEVDRLWAENVLVLRYGEIEDYLPSGMTDIKGIVSMITDRNWINRVQDPLKRSELGRIIARILGLPNDVATDFVAELQDGPVEFPAAISADRATTVPAA
jgi:predicted ATPase